ncbi:MAG: hypothetical protein LBI12_06620, partial [Treponema sp.]|nr:hypothetical protein [Treponema sp.]
ITRISPDNQEKVSRIEIYFRNYGPVKKSSLQSLWMLDRAKAKLSHFLRALMEMQSSFVFSIRSAGGSWEIEDAEDLETFLDEFAGLSFSPPGNEAVFYAGKGEPLSKGQLYVFSTACDVGLTGFLFACQPRPVSLFFVQPAPHQSAGEEKEMLYIRDFPAKGCVPLAHWVFSGKIKQTNSGTVKENAAGGSGAGKIENIYAETRL